MPIDFLAIGNLTRDTTPQGFRLGGTVSFAAVTARRLGWRPGVLTRASLDGLEPDGRPEKAGTRRTTGLPGTPLAGIPVHLMPSPVTTTFTNIYTERGRTQVIEAVADPVTPDGLPSEWAETPVVLLGSIAREIPPSWADMFPPSLLGIAPQGHMRSWDAAGHVLPARWENAGPLLRRADAVIVSREDVGGDDAYIAELAAQTRLLIVTDGWHGATVYENDEVTRIPARGCARGRSDRCRRRLCHFVPVAPGRDQGPSGGRPVRQRRCLPIHRSARNGCHPHAGRGRELARGRMQRQLPLPLQGNQQT